MAAQDLMTWMGLVAWMGLAARVTKKKRTYWHVLWDDGDPRLDGLDDAGVPDGSGGPGHVEEENLMTWMGLIARMDLAAKVP